MYISVCVGRGGVIVYISVCEVGRGESGSVWLQLKAKVHVNSNGELIITSLEAGDLWF